MKKSNMSVERILFQGIIPLLLMLLVADFSAAFESGKKDLNQQGSYQVVGIGPGDADLMTGRALAAITSADIVFCNGESREKLSSVVDFKGKEVIEGYSVLFRFYGKDCNSLSEEERTKHKMSCEAYQEKQKTFAVMVRKAVAGGKKVVLLSSGDPTIYGPGIWTLKELSDLNPVLIPGLSSFNAATAALKVGLGEVILTAPFKGRGGKEVRDKIEDLVKYDKATVVIFMPREMDDLLKRISSACPPDTPLAAVSFAGHKGKEKVIVGTVADMGKKLEGEDTGATLIYVGKALNEASCRFAPSKKEKNKGKFYLVGAGPGDSDLATLRAVNVLKKADMIFTAEKISARFKAELAGKTIIDGYHRLFPFYGKNCSEVTEKERSNERMSCEEYHKKQEEVSRMVRKAVAEGKHVAMLDSGDPLIYGPCSWTLTEFRDIETEVVPGLSCFNAANAALRQGVTEGSSSHSVVFASGWTVDEMSALQSTLVLFTMRTEFEKFITTLSKHYPADTPIAIVSSAGYAEKEKVVRSKLGTILNDTGKDELPFEYLLYVGDFLNGNFK